MSFFIAALAFYGGFRFSEIVWRHVTVSKTDQG
jgi:hypothetical protein